MTEKTQDFRPAWWIELHDINLVLVEKGADAGWFWHGEEFDTRHLSINAKDIAVICQIAGLRHLALEDRLDHTREKHPNGKSSYEAVKDYQINIYRGDPKQVEAKSLLAHVAAPGLLAIQMHQEAETGAAWVEEFTYSGSFTVRWAAEES